MGINGGEGSNFKLQVCTVSITTLGESLMGLVGILSSSRLVEACTIGLELMESSRLEELQFIKPAKSSTLD